MTFSIATYPTIDAADTGSSPYIVYRVTIIVWWSSTQPGPKQLVGQTLVFSPASVSGDCRSSNHPFNAPCQPFLYSSAVAGGGYIDIIPDQPTADQPISGDPFDSVELDLPLTSLDAQIEQISSVFGSTPTSGGTISATSKQTTGASTASVSADDDPGTSRAIWQCGPVSQTGSSPCSIELPADPAAGANWVSVSPGAADSGSELVTADASISNPYPCDDVLANQLVTNLPGGSRWACPGLMDKLVGVDGGLTITPDALGTCKTCGASSSNRQRRCNLAPSRRRPSTPGQPPRSITAEPASEAVYASGERPPSANAQ